jgi:hypothetical protein
VIGAGGRVAASGPVNVTVIGAPWTTGTAIAFTPLFPSFISTRMGFAHGPASMDGTTTLPGGSLQLVSPITVRTNLGADLPVLFGFVTATLHFVPEPASVVLVAVGLGLLAAGERRRRASRLR